MKDVIGQCDFRNICIFYVCVCLCVCCFQEDVHADNFVCMFSYFLLAPFFLYTKRGTQGGGRQYHNYRRMHDALIKALMDGRMVYIILHLLLLLSISYQGCTEVRGDLSSYLSPRGRFHPTTSASLFAATHEITSSAVSHTTMVSLLSISMCAYFSINQTMHLETHFCWGVSSSPWSFCERTGEKGSSLRIGPLRFYAIFFSLCCSTLSVFFLFLPSADFIVFFFAKGCPLSYCICKVVLVAQPQLSTTHSRYRARYRRPFFTPQEKHFRVRLS
jgi:hypothetical protein